MILVIDVGTTGLRAALIGDDGHSADIEYRPFAPVSPFPGMVEFDAAAMSDAVVDAATTVLRRAGDPTVKGVGIASQRASTIVWERSTGAALGPGIGWQDLRTIGECLTAKAEHGLALAPNQSATKIQWLLANAVADRDPAELCVGTVDSWVAWNLSQGGPPGQGLLASQELALDQRLGDLHRIGGGALPEVVADLEEPEPRAILLGADATDADRVATDDVPGRRNGRRILGEFDTGKRRDPLAGSLGIDGALGLDQETRRVADRHRDTHTRDAHRKFGARQDLAQLRA